MRNKHVVFRFASAPCAAWTYVPRGGPPASLYIHAILEPFGLLRNRRRAAPFPGGMWLPDGWSCLRISYRPRRSVASMSGKVTFVQHAARKWREWVTFVTISVSVDTRVRYVRDVNGSFPVATRMAALKVGGDLAKDDIIRLIGKRGARHLKHRPRTWSAA